MTLRIPCDYCKAYNKEPNCEPCDHNKRWNERLGRLMKTRICHNVVWSSWQHFEPPDCVHHEPATSKCYYEKFPECCLKDDMPGIYKRFN